ncbi:acyl-CoA synthetase [Rhodococcus sp. NPDC003318]|uniref:acyl-CoA synthetase n=1 Tax=Rhodococcus sp. NPDC003318 TaxID=3364503 RepID=UPI00368CEDC8
MYPGAYARTTPNKPAVIMAETGETVTFGELETRSIRLAHHFAAIGLRRGDHVALLTDNNPKVFEIYWAAMRSGLYLTAVNRHLTADEVAYIVDDCGAAALLVSATLGDLAVAVAERTPGLTHRLAFGGEVAGHVDLDTVTAQYPDTPPADQPRGADMLYSSGTTGRPKGIKPDLPNRQIDEPGDTMTEMNARVWGVTSDTVYLSPAPLYHAAPLRTCASVQALGGTVVVMGRFDAEKALEYIERYRVTYAQWVPTMFVRMLKLPAETRAKYDVSSLQVAVHAAAPCPVDVKRAMIEWWGPVLSEYYSSTELNGMTMVDTPEWLDHPGTVGRAVLGVVHICDDDGNEVPSGTVGSVYFERDVLPFHYHNDPEKTASAQHPAHPTWTTTGDVGYLDEGGYLFLTDRATFMIISGGVNIYPQEIENCLALHPAVIDCAVIGIPDPEMGESVLAVIHAAPDATPGPELAEEITDFLRGTLARYKVPRRVEFSADLPRTPTGKLVKRTLKDRYSIAV